MADTIGFIDGLEGSAVCGWARSRTAGSDRPASIIVRDHAGKLLARGVADLDRPDVGRLGFGSTACGFRLQLRRIGDAGALHVSADGVEITGSPVPVGAGHFDGGLALLDGVAKGWVTERIDGSGSIPVQLHDQDGVLAGEGVTAISADRDDGIARFSIPLGNSCFGRSDLRVRASANGVRFAEAQGALRLDGYLDALSPSHCSGWLLSPDAIARRLAIEVFRDGFLTGSGLCEYSRDDVRDRYPRASRVGFEIRLDPPPPATRRDSHCYSIRLKETDAELFGGPFLIEDRQDGVEAARRIARRTHADPALSEAEREVLRRALDAFIGVRRHGKERIRVRAPGPLPRDGNSRRLTIVIPIYRGLELTRACIESVLATRNPARDALVLVNDCSPEPEMAALLDPFAREPGVFVLGNPENQGFVRSANRGIAFCRTGDVLLLNSDTRVFPGVFDELCRVANGAPNIGTVTALSNNATVFSYPHLSLPNAALADIEWSEIAEIAREANGGAAIDVPTGHGFCMLIRREALDRAGLFNEAFGRGYGEENDFCQRLADLGFRNVAAPGAFVEHRESASFGDEKRALVEANLGTLGRMYPDYGAEVMAFEREDGLRHARWPLDIARLRRAAVEGAQFALVVTNWLGGGSRRAIADIEAAVGYGEARRLSLTCRPDGVIELLAENPAMRAIFAPEEIEALFDMLRAAPISRVLVHQVLGFPLGFIDGLTAFVAGRQAIFYAHDFYSICPRVTMIDAAGQFCDVAAPETCRRCLADAGPHEASRLDVLDPESYRLRMGGLLRAFRHVVAPSVNTTSYLHRVWPDLTVASIPHPEALIRPPASPRVSGSGSEILLLGGIGPHKGSASLLAISRRARLSHPDLRFRVIGQTDIDAELRAIGNVGISGLYEPSELPDLLAEIAGCIALFLHNWPETYSYTVSEAVAHGFFPLVPDLGAPAERVREAGWGAVFGFPIVPNEVLDAITAASNQLRNVPSDMRISRFVAADAAARHRALMGVGSNGLRNRKKSRALISQE